MDQTEQIEAYLDDLLSPEERAAFERELEENPELGRELIAQKRLREMLQEAERIALRKKVEAISRQFNSKPKQRYLILKLAAVGLIALLSTYYVVHLQYTDAALLEQYDSTYPDRVTTMGSQEDRITAAMDLYNNGRFSEAANALRVLRENHQVAGLEIYEVVALRKSGSTAKAAGLAQKMLKSPGEMRAAFEWELVLCYLAQGDENKARALLQVFLSRNYGYKTKEAKQLQKDLSSFWR